MTVAYDTTNAPAVVSWNAGVSPFSGSTAAFTPPAGEGIFVIVQADDASGACSTAITDNKSGTWTLLGRSNTGASNEVWFRQATASDSGLVVTSTVTGGWNAAGDARMTVVLTTGQASTQNGTVVKTTAALTASLTPTKVGSVILGSFTDDTRQGTLTANAATTIINQASLSGGNASTYCAFQGAAATTALTATTYGFSSGTAGGRDILLVEVVPAATGGVTSTATTGSNAWSGVAAKSAAGIIATTSLAGLMWSGLAAQSVAGAPVSAAATAGSAAWSGLQAKSVANRTDTTGPPGSLILSGTAPSLLFEDVVNGTGPGAQAWSGLRATSVGAGASPASLGGLAWSGLTATSVAQAPSSATAMAGSVAWSGLAASSVGVGQAPAGAGSLAFSGLPATSVAGQQGQTALGSMLWGGLAASSRSGALSAASAGSVVLEGVQAITVAGSVSPTDLPSIVWAGLPATSVAASPNDGTPVAVPTLTLADVEASLTITTADSTLELSDMAFTVGDTAPALAGNVNANLTGASVEIRALRPDGTDIVRAATVTSAVTGGWSMAWAAGDLSSSGVWEVTAKVTFSDGTAQTFGPAYLTVEPAIG